MSKYILHFPPEIKPMEDANLWLNAIKFLYDQWERNPMDEHDLVCLAIEAWYAILELDYLADHPINPVDNRSERCFIHDILCKSVKLGFEMHSNGVLFNMYIGYAAKVTPLNFERFINTNEWSKDGLSMIYKAYLQDTTDMLTQMFYYESVDYNSADFTAIAKKLWTTLPPSQWGDSSVQQHFFCIFDGEKYCRTGEGS